jgi:hypothetical protein
MVLLVSLLVLLLFAVIASTVLRGNLLQLRMAGNDEAQNAALQQGLAAVDALFASRAGFHLNGGVGHRVCAVDATDSSCDARLLRLPVGLGRAGAAMDYWIVRAAPLEQRLPVMDETDASSTAFYRAARFEIGARYDDTAQGLARAAVVQGVVVRLVD